MSEAPSESEERLKEHRRLEEYNRAVADYHASTAKLVNSRWSMPQAEYLKVYREAELARLRCEKIRLSLEPFNVHRAESS